MRKQDPGDDVWSTKGFTIGDTIYLRESGMRDPQYIQEVLKHEDYHPFSKLEYSGYNIAKIEGFGEIMKYEDIMKDPRVPQDIKDKTAIIEGDYREYAAQQYLVGQIIGKDNLVIGHLVRGDSYLEQKFDDVAGKGEYRRILDANTDDGKKIKMLLKIHKIKYPNSHDYIKFQVKRILNEGKYDY